MKDSRGRSSLQEENLKKGRPKMKMMHCEKGVAKMEDVKK